MTVDPESNISESNVYRMLALIFGAIHAQAVTAAAELGIADLLRGTELSLEELAAATHTDTGALERVLRMLVQLEVISEPEPGNYTLTGMGELLQKDHPHSLYNYARLTNCDTVIQVAARLLQGMKTGESQFTALFNTGFYKSLPQRPDEAEKFAGAMQDIAQQDILAINQAYDFTRCETLVDVGGGQGHLLAALLEFYPNLRAVLFDLPEVVKDSPALLQPYIEDGRCKVIEGNFLECVPAGGDIYILKRVLSHCTDTDSLRLLKNVRRNMNADGRLILADPDPDSLYGASFDVLMLVLLGGGLRTEIQLQKLFDESGFKYERTVAASAALNFVEAIPAK